MFEEEIALLKHGNLTKENEIEELRADIETLKE